MMSMKGGVVAPPSHLTPASISNTLPLRLQLTSHTPQHRFESTQALITACYGISLPPISAMQPSQTPPHHQPSRPCSSDNQLSATQQLQLTCSYLLNISWTHHYAVFQAEVAANDIAWLQTTNHFVLMRAIRIFLQFAHPAQWCLPDVFAAHRQAGTTTSTAAAAGGGGSSFSSLMMSEWLHALQFAIELFLICQAVPSTPTLYIPAHDDQSDAAANAATALVPRSKTFISDLLTTGYIYSANSMHYSSYITMYPAIMEEYLFVFSLGVDFLSSFVIPACSRREDVYHWSTIPRIHILQSQLDLFWKITLCPETSATVSPSSSFSITPQHLPSPQSFLSIWAGPIEQLQAPLSRLFDSISLSILLHHNVFTATSHIYDTATSPNRTINPFACIETFLETALPVLLIDSAPSFHWLQSPCASFIVSLSIAFPQYQTSLCSMLSQTIAFQVPTSPGLLSQISGSFASQMFRHGGVHAAHVPCCDTFPFALIVYITCLQSSALRVFLPPNINISTSYCDDPIITMYTNYDASSWVLVQPSSEGHQEDMHDFGDENEQDSLIIPHSDNDDDDDDENDDQNSYHRANTRKNATLLATTQQQLEKTSITRQPYHQSTFRPNTQPLPFHLEPIPAHHPDWITTFQSTSPSRLTFLTWFEHLTPSPTTSQTSSSSSSSSSSSAIPAISTSISAPTSPINVFSSFFTSLLSLSDFIQLELALTTQLELASRTFLLSFLTFLSQLPFYLSLPAVTLPQLATRQCAYLRSEHLHSNTTDMSTGTSLSIHPLLLFSLHSVSIHPSTTLSQFSEQLLSITTWFPELFLASQLAHQIFYIVLRCAPLTPAAAASSGSSSSASLDTFYAKIAQLTNGAFIELLPSLIEFLQGIASHSYLPPISNHQSQHSLTLQPHEQPPLHDQSTTTPSIDPATGQSSTDPQALDLNSISCLCPPGHTPNTPTTLYISCDHCHKWFHASCVGYSSTAQIRQDVISTRSFCCPTCTTVESTVLIMSSSGYGLVSAAMQRNVRSTFDFSPLHQIYNITTSSTNPTTTLSRTKRKNKAPVTSFLPSSLSAEQLCTFFPAWFSQTVSSVTHPANLSTLYLGILAYYTFSSNPTIFQTQATLARAAAAASTTSMTAITRTQSSIMSHSSSIPASSSLSTSTSSSSSFSWLEASTLCVSARLCFTAQQVFTIIAHLAEKCTTLAKSSGSISTAASQSVATTITSAVSTSINDTILATLYSTIHSNDDSSHRGVSTTTPARLVSLPPTHLAKLTLYFNHRSALCPASAGLYPSSSSSTTRSSKSGNGSANHAAISSVPLAAGDNSGLLSVDFLEDVFALTHRTICTQLPQSTQTQRAEITVMISQLLFFYDFWHQHNSSVLNYNTLLLPPLIAASLSAADEQPIFCSSASSNTLSAILDRVQSCMIGNPNNTTDIQQHHEQMDKNQHAHGTVPPSTPFGASPSLFPLAVFYQTQMSLTENIIIRRQVAEAQLQQQQQSQQQQLHQRTTRHKQTTQQPISPIQLAFDVAQHIFHITIQQQLQLFHLATFRHELHGVLLYIVTKAKAATISPQTLRSLSSSLISTVSTSDGLTRQNMFKILARLTAVNPSLLNTRVILHLLEETLSNGFDASSIPNVIVFSRQLHLDTATHKSNIPPGLFYLRTIAMPLHANVLYSWDTVHHRNISNMSAALPPTFQATTLGVINENALFSFPIAIQQHYLSLLLGCAQSSGHDGRLALRKKALLILRNAIVQGIVKSSCISIVPLVTLFEHQHLSITSLDNNTMDDSNASRVNTTLENRSNETIDSSPDNKNILHDVPESSILNLRQFPSDLRQLLPYAKPLGLVSSPSSSTISPSTSSSSASTSPSSSSSPIHIAIQFPPFTTFFSNPNCIRIMFHFLQFVRDPNATIRQTVVDALLHIFLTQAPALPPNPTIQSSFQHVPTQCVMTTITSQLLPHHIPWVSPGLTHSYCQASFVLPLFLFPTLARAQALLLVRLTSLLMKQSAADPAIGLTQTAPPVIATTVLTRQNTPSHILASSSHLDTTAPSPHIFLFNTQCYIGNVSILAEFFRTILADEFIAEVTPFRHLLSSSVSSSSTTTTATTTSTKQSANKRKQALQFHTFSAMLFDSVIALMLSLDASPPAHKSCHVIHQPGLVSHDNHIASAANGGGSSNPGIVQPTIYPQCNTSAPWRDLPCQGEHSSLPSRCAFLQLLLILTQEMPFLILQSQARVLSIVYIFIQARNRLVATFHDESTSNQGTTTTESPPDESPELRNLRLTSITEFCCTVRLISLIVPLLMSNSIESSIEHHDSTENNPDSDQITGNLYQPAIPFARQTLLKSAIHSAICYFFPVATQTMFPPAWRNPVYLQVFSRMLSLMLLFSYCSLKTCQSCDFHSISIITSLSSSSSSSSSSSVADDNHSSVVQLSHHLSPVISQPLAAMYFPLLQGKVFDRLNQAIVAIQHLEPANLHISATADHPALSLNSHQLTTCFTCSLRIVHIYAVYTAINALLHALLYRLCTENQAPWLKPSATPITLFPCYFPIGSLPFHLKSPSDFTATVVFLSAMQHSPFLTPLLSIAFHHPLFRLPAPPHPYASIPPFAAAWNLPFPPTSLANAVHPPVPALYDYSTAHPCANPLLLSVTLLYATHHLPSYRSIQLYLTVLTLSACCGLTPQFLSLPLPHPLNLPSSSSSPTASSSSLSLPPSTSQLVKIVLGSFQRLPSPLPHPGSFYLISPDTVLYHAMDFPISPRQIELAMNKGINIVIEQFRHNVLHAVLLLLRDSPFEGLPAVDPQQYTDGVGMMSTLHTVLQHGQKRQMMTASRTTPYHTQTAIPTTSTSSEQLLIDGDPSALFDFHAQNKQAVAQFLNFSLKQTVLRISTSQRQIDRIVSLALMESLHQYGNLPVIDFAGSLFGTLYDTNNVIASSALRIMSGLLSSTIRIQNISRDTLGTCFGKGLRQILLSVEHGEPLVYSIEWNQQQQQQSDTPLDDQHDQQQQEQQRQYKQLWIRLFRAAWCYEQLNASQPTVIMSLGYKPLIPIIQPSDTVLQIGFQLETLHNLLDDKTAQQTANWNPYHDAIVTPLPCLSLTWHTIVAHQYSSQLSSSHGEGGVSQPQLSLDRASSHFPARRTTSMLHKATTRQENIAAQNISTTGSSTTTNTVTIGCHFYCPDISNYIPQQLDEWCPQQLCAMQSQLLLLANPSSTKTSSSLTTATSYLPSSIIPSYRLLQSIYHSAHPVSPLLYVFHRDQVDNALRNPTTKRQLRTKAARSVLTSYTSCTDICVKQPSLAWVPSIFPRLAPTQAHRKAFIPAFIASALSLTPWFTAVDNVVQLVTSSFAPATSVSFLNPHMVQSLASADPTWSPFPFSQTQNDITRDHTSPTSHQRAFLQRTQLALTAGLGLPDCLSTVRAHTDRLSGSLGRDVSYNCARVVPPQTIQDCELADAQQEMSSLRHMAALTDPFRVEILESCHYYPLPLVHYVQSSRLSTESTSSSPSSSPSAANRAGYQPKYQNFVSNAQQSLLHQSSLQPQQSSLAALQAFVTTCSQIAMVLPLNTFEASLVVTSIDDIVTQHALRAMRFFVELSLAMGFQRGLGQFLLQVLRYDTKQLNTLSSSEGPSDTLTTLVPPSVPSATISSVLNSIWGELPPSHFGSLRQQVLTQLLLDPDNCLQLDSLRQSLAIINDGVIVRAFLLCQVAPLPVLAHLLHITTHYITAVSCLYLLRAQLVMAFKLNVAKTATATTTATTTTTTTTNQHKLSAMGSKSIDVPYHTGHLPLFSFHTAMPSVTTALSIGILQTTKSHCSESNALITVSPLSSESDIASVVSQISALSSTKIATPPLCEVFTSHMLQLFKPTSTSRAQLLHTHAMLAQNQLQSTALLSESSIDAFATSAAAAAALAASESASTPTSLSHTTIATTCFTDIFNQESKLHGTADQFQQQEKTVLCASFLFHYITTWNSPFFIRLNASLLSTVTLSHHHGVGGGMVDTDENANSGAAATAAAVQAEIDQRCLRYIHRFSLWYPALTRSSILALYAFFKFILPAQYNDIAVVYKRFPALPICLTSTIMSMGSSPAQYEVASLAYAFLSRQHTVATLVELAQFSPQEPDSTPSTNDTMDNDDMDV